MGGLSADDFCACGALVDWDAEDARRCRGCGEEIEMDSDLVGLTKGDLAATFKMVAPEVVAAIAAEFLAMLVAQADTSAERAIDSLVVCQDDDCATSDSSWRVVDPKVRLPAITADAREHDGKMICPKCHRAAKRAESDAAGIHATHGPEIRGVRGTS